MHFRKSKLKILSKYMVLTALRLDNDLYVYSAIKFFWRNENIMSAVWTKQIFIELSFCWLCWFLSSKQQPDMSLLHTHVVQGHKCVLQL